MEQIQRPAELRFDAVSRALARATSRREALRLVVAALLGGAAAACKGGVGPSCEGGCIGNDGKCWTCAATAVCTLNTTGKTGCSQPTAGGVSCCNPSPASAEAFCSQLPTIGTGRFFYCATSQTNLQGGLPNGWLGFCGTPDRSFAGLVGYVAVTFNGGIFLVQPTQDEARAQCDAVNTPGLTQCNSVIRCTRT